MSERTEERTREVEPTETAVGSGTDGSGTTTRQDTAEEEDGGSYFSARALLFALVAVGGGMVAGSFVPLIPFIAFLGVPVGAFVYGLLASERRYVETGVAGALVSGTGAVLSLFTQLALRGIAGNSLGAGRLFAVAAGVGLVLSLVGHYFGRDLRAGLTEELP